MASCSNMDFIQGLIDVGSISGSEWHIVTNDGSFDILNNCSGEVLFTILNDGSIGTGPNYSANFLTTYSTITVGTSFGS